MDATPPLPATVPLSKSITTSLFYGYVRIQFDIHKIPDDIMDLLGYFIPFELKLIDYEEAMDILLNRECCFGFYDRKASQWRTVVFLLSWPDKRKLMVRFINDINQDTMDKFHTFKTFPIWISQSPRFKVSFKTLSDCSGVPASAIEKLKKRQQRFQKIEGKKVSTKTSPPKRHFEVPSDWIIDSKRTDFTGVFLIGYLCDNGEVILGHVLRQTPGKMFIHFEHHGVREYGKAYNWIHVPCHRLVAPKHTLTQEEIQLICEQQYTKHN
eukprot:365230_1